MLSISWYAFTGCNPVCVKTAAFHIFIHLMLTSSSACRSLPKTSKDMSHFTRSTRRIHFLLAAFWRSSLYLGWRASYTMFAESWLTLTNEFFSWLSVCRQIWPAHWYFSVLILLAMSMTLVLCWILWSSIASNFKLRHGPSWVSMSRLHLSKQVERTG